MNQLKEITITVKRKSFGRRLLFMLLIGLFVGACIGIGTVGFILSKTGYTIVKKP